MMTTPGSKASRSEIGTGRAPARRVPSRAILATTWAAKTATSLLDAMSPRGLNATSLRRDRMLGVLLIGTSGVSLAVMGQLLALSLSAGKIVESGILRSTAVFLVVAVMVRAVSRMGHVRLAAGFFVFFVTLMILLNDAPEQLVGGRSSFFLVIPVMMASMVLAPAASFLVLVVVAGALFGLSFGVDAPLPVIQVGGLFLVALVAWLSARTLEHALAGMSTLNQELEHRVKERTRELTEALDHLQEAQAQRLQCMKMAAVGQLAGGVAHEINNPLAVILGFAQAMDHRVPEGDPLRVPVGSIVRESLRCKNLVQELLTFSRTAKGTTEDVDLNGLVHSSVVLLEARARTQAVQITREPWPDALVVQANRTQIQQVIINLANNALDAMATGGKLVLRTRLEGGASASAVIEVVDTGTGIPKEALPRMFEPFFTTKEAGKGTGLGLSLVHEIVQQHGGNVVCDSEVGRGTTFTVVLPARGDVASPVQGKVAS